MLALFFGPSEPEAGDPAPDPALECDDGGAALVGAADHAEFIPKGSEIGTTDDRPRNAALFAHNLEIAVAFLVSDGVEVECPEGFNVRNDLLAEVGLGGNGVEEEREIMNLEGEDPFGGGKLVLMEIKDTEAREFGEIGDRSQEVVGEVELDEVVALEDKVELMFWDAGAAQDENAEIGRNGDIE